MTELTDIDVTTHRRRGGPPPTDDVLLEVRDLRTYFHVLDGTVPAVDGVVFQLKRGKSLGDRRRVGLGQERDAR